MMSIQLSGALKSSLCVWRATADGQILAVSSRRTPWGAIQTHIQLGLLEYNHSATRRMLKTWICWPRRLPKGCDHWTLSGSCCACVSGTVMFQFCHNCMYNWQDALYSFSFVHDDNDTFLGCCLILCNIQDASVGHSPLTCTASDKYTPHVCFPRI